MITILNNNKSVQCTSKLFKSTDNYFIIVVTKDIRELCNNAYTSSWNNVFNMLLNTNVPKIILADPETLCKDDKKLLNQLPKNLIIKVKYISMQLKDLVMPQFKDQTSKFIHLKIVIKETLNDSLCKYCIPYSRLAKLAKCHEELQSFFNEIVEATFPGIITKSFTSLIIQSEEVPYFLETIDNKEDQKILDTIIPNKIFSNEV
jgi:hypothetical protein